MGSLSAQLRTQLEQVLARVKEWEAWAQQARDLIALKDRRIEELEEKWRSSVNTGSSLADQLLAAEARVRELEALRIVFRPAQDERIAELEARVEELAALNEQTLAKLQQQIQLRDQAQARVTELEAALQRIAKPEYGIGFNGLRRIARKALS